LKILKVEIQFAPIVDVKLNSETLSFYPCIYVF